MFIVLYIPNFYPLESKNHMISCNEEAIWLFEASIINNLLETLTKHILSKMDVPHWH